MTSVTACRDPNCAQFAEVGLIETCEPTACECLCSDADQAQGTKPIWVDSSPVNVVSARLSSVHSERDSATLYQQQTFLFEHQQKLTEGIETIENTVLRT